MNSRQLRRQRHTIKMAKRGLRKFGKSMRWLMFQESPLTQYLKTKRMDVCDGGTYISEPIHYAPLDGNVYVNR